MGTPPDDQHDTVDLGKLPQVRPSRADEERGPDPFAGWSRLGWELLALALFGFGILAFGVLAWLIAALLVGRSSYWEVRDKVRVLFGVPVTLAVLAVLWAWISATQIQESDDSGRRLDTAGEAFAQFWAWLPELSCAAALGYLTYLLARDHHPGR